MTTLGSEIGQKHPTRAAKPWQDQRLVHGGVALMTCAAVGLTSLGLAAPANAQQKGTPSDAEARTLDGSGNNTRDPSLGSAGTQYLRQADPNYADGIAAPTEGPNSRTVSNRVFADLGQNVFSGRGVTQWSWTWGQFLDHTFGLREGGDESAPIDFDVDDPLERFQNDIGAIDFTRSAAAPGTGNNSPREQLNTVSSFIDAHAVYGSSEDRLDWLREGSRDGDPTNNSAKLLLSPGEYLPRATERADAQDAPTMDVEGRLRMDPDSRAIAGDMRANENIALTATHTLFAREHNRIVDQLPADMDEQEKFETARRVVGATQQYITYTEFLPAMGIKLPKYRGYNRKVNPTISNEFATVGYRAHSQVHGEIEMEAETADYTPEQIAAFEAAGIEVTVAGSEIELAVPLNLAFFAPDLVEDLGLTAILTGLGLEAQYANDEQIDNQLRSVLFQIPGQGVADLPACLDGEEMPNCFAGVTDLGAIDIERARDHGVAGYNELRKAYGLAPKTSFKSITGESVESFQNVPNIDQNEPMNDPAILDFMALFDGEGNQLEPDSDAA
nr:peroxidase family protein [Actinomycetes bacterium]